MWYKTENGEAIKFPEYEESGNYVILRKDFRLVEETGERPMHYEWMEWQMTKEQYEVYQQMSSLIDEQSAALVELAKLVSEVV